MRAMVLNELNTPLQWTEMPDRLPGPNEIRVKVGACGVCRTDLHVVDGDLPGPKLPIIPGHEIVGRLGVYGFGAAAHIIASSRKPHPTMLQRANEALADLRNGRFEGAAVLVP